MKEEEIKEIKTLLEEHERRISSLEKMIMTGLGKGYKRFTGGKKGRGKRKKGPSASGRPGPGVMIEQLIAEGFFKKQHRVMGDIIKHCKNNFAYRYKASEFSPTLGRCIRNQKLKREKNKDGRFEYFQN